MDIGDTGCGGRGARTVRTWFVGLTVQDAQGQRWCGKPTACVIGIAASIAGIHFHEVDARLHESLFTGVLVQRLDGAQHAGPRTEILVQCGCGFSMCTRLQIGLHVTTTEAVNGLLGVTDQEQGR